MSKLEFNRTCEQFKKARKLALDNDYNNYEAARFAEGYFTARTKMLKDAVVVYGSIVKHKDEYEWAQEFKQGDTHKALLIEIQEIEKK